MPRFIETLCFENGHYPLLDLHQQRLEHAFEAYFPGATPHDLSRVLPKLEFQDRHKVRLVYDAEMTDVEFSAYHRRPLQSIRLVTDDSIDYAHKYENRASLEKLFAQRGTADEILIIKNGLVTDSFYANPAFWDGQSWVVPKSCLLNGVRRQHLLRSGRVREVKIGVRDIPSFQKICLINALMDLGESEAPIRAIT